MSPPVESTTSAISRAVRVAVPLNAGARGSATPRPTRPARLVCRRRPSNRWQRCARRDLFGDDAQAAPDRDPTASSAFGSAPAAAVATAAAAATTTTAATAAATAATDRPRSRPPPPPPPVRGRSGHAAGRLGPEIAVFGAEFVVEVVLERHVLDARAVAPPLRRAAAGPSPLEPGPRAMPTGVSEILLLRSMSSTTTSISSPSDTTSSTRSTRRPPPSLEMCTRPSRPGRMLTNAPNLVMLTTRPL